MEAIRLDLGSSPIFLVDCQTSGTSPKSGGRIIELAWCTASAEVGRLGPISATFVRLPEGAKLPRKVSAITGIAAQDLEGAPELGEALGMCAGARSAAGSPAPMAHYARFERSFFEAAREESGTDAGLSDLVCTYEITRRLLPGLPRRGLRAVAGYFGAPIVETKRASAHIEATALVWRELCAMLIEREKIACVEELRDWLHATKPAPKKGQPIPFPLPRAKRLGLPKSPGVYRMISRSGQILYVGKATCLKDRVNSYFRGKRGAGGAKLEMAMQVWDLEITERATPLEAALLEADEIKRLDPPYNQQLKARQKKLWYAAEVEPLDLVNRPDPDHPLGPFAGRSVIEEFGALTALVRGEPAALAAFGEALDPQIVDGALALWCERRAVEPGLMPRLPEFDALGRRLIDERLARKEAERAANDDLEVEDEEPVEFAWTPEAAADHFDRIVRRATRLLRRASLIRSMMDATLCWRAPSGERRRLEVRSGRASASGARRGGEAFEPIASSGAPIDLRAYDRLKVLIAEIKRVLSAGRPASLWLQGAEAPLEGCALERALRYV